MTFRTVLLAAVTVCAVVAPAAAMAQDYGYGGYRDHEYRDDRGLEFRRAEDFRIEREHEAWRDAEFRRAAWRHRFEARDGWERDHRWSYGYDRPHPSYGYGFDGDHREF